MFEGHGFKSGMVKLTIREPGKLNDLPSEFREELARTGGRTGITVSPVPCYLVTLDAFRNMEGH